MLMLLSCSCLFVGLCIGLLIVDTQVFKKRFLKDFERRCFLD